MSDRLGTAKWEDPATISQKYPYAPGTFWLGRAEDGEAVGYKDDRHICLVSGTRGGKGASVIVNNLCMWPGSAVVVDPKGENATITAARRGNGSEYCDGMGQAVHVLDPFKAALVDDSYRSSFNPLDSLDPHNEETRDEANRIASAIIVVRENAAEPFWDEAARDMLRGLILYVLTAKHFMADERNLITVRQLILRGEWQIYEAIQADGHDEEKIDAPHLLLWRNMERSKAFDGLVSGLGSRFRGTMKSEKMYEGILQAAVVNTEFLDSPGMRRVLCRSDFSLKELKTRPEGMTLYLSLPQRFMETHYRWLRMMVALTINEMEIHPGRPQTGHPVLMILDEFAGLKRMTMIESAVAQLAGFGVKLFYVLQSLEQLKGVYKDHWETFVANAGIKMFFSVGDPFTQKYVSTMAGETQVTLQQKTVSESRGDSESHAIGETESRSTSRSTSDTTGTSSSFTDGTSHSVNTSRTEGTNRSQNVSESSGETSGWSSVSRPIPFTDQSYQKSSYGVLSRNTGFSRGLSEGTSSSVSQGVTDGTSRSRTDGDSRSSSEGLTVGENFGSSRTRTESKSTTHGDSIGENVQRRPLIQPDEVGRFFSRIDDKSSPAYPGLALVMVTGTDPVVVRRTHYFEDRQFVRRFSPHPDHEFVPFVLPPPPTATFDEVIVRKLFDDYWSGEKNLQDTRLLLGAEVEALEKSHAAVCKKIVIQDDWKKSVEEYCEAARSTLVRAFSMARGVKSGDARYVPAVVTSVYCHDLISRSQALNRVAELLADPETRPSSIPDIANPSDSNRAHLLLSVSYKAVPSNGLGFLGTSYAMQGFFQDWENKAFAAPLKEPGPLQAAGSAIKNFLMMMVFFFLFLGVVYVVASFVYKR